MATDLRQAFTTIRKDDALTQKFISDPKATLAGLGVDTSKLKIKTTGTPAASAGSKNVTASAVNAANVSGCGSIGCVVCGTVGS